MQPDHYLPTAPVRPVDHDPEIRALNDRWYRRCAELGIETAYPNPYAGQQVAPNRAAA